MKPNDQSAALKNTKHTDVHCPHVSPVWSSGTSVGGNFPIYRVSRRRMYTPNPGYIPHTKSRSTCWVVNVYGVLVCNVPPSMRTCVCNVRPPSMQKWTTVEVPTNTFSTVGIMSANQNRVCLNLRSLWSPFAFRRLYFFSL